MQIFIEISIIAVLTVASWLYLKKTNDDQKYSIGKKLIIYQVAMFAILSAICVELNIVYDSNTMVHNTKLLVLIAFIVPLAWKDYYEYKIPNKVILVMLSIRVLLMIWELVIMKKDFFVELKDCVLACVLIGLFLILVHIIFKNSIGMGDVKLMMIMALYQGFYGVFSSIFFSMISVCILGVALLIVKKKKRKDALPFAPAVLFGTSISIVLSGI